MTGACTVGVGQTLDIQAGVRVLFDVEVPFLVMGTLNANGALGSWIEFEGRNADGWGGIALMNRASNTFSYVKITGCYLYDQTYPGNSGGGLRVLGVGTSADLDHCYIRGNYAGGSGGGVFVDSASVTMTDCAVASNTTGSYGGGICVSYGSLTLTRTRVDSNGTQNFWGGGIYALVSTLTMDAVTARYNSANQNGGGVSAEWSHTTAVACTLSNNWASGGGGGLHVRGSDISVIGTEIRNNQSSTSYGGGVQLIETTAALLRCVIAGNSEYGYAGGSAIEVYRSIASITNCTVIGNYSEVEGAISTNTGDGVACSATVTNCIVGDNYAAQFYEGAGTTLTVRYSDVENGWPGEGNINLDPLFVNAEISDYRLLLSSPCVDAGDPASPLDADGTRADMGAYPTSYTGTRISGLLSTQTWAIESSPVHIAVPCTVGVGQTLTIDPGVDVIMHQDAGITVLGQINAIGTEADSIRFIADSAASWTGIVINSPDSTTMKYVRISGGSAGYRESEGDELGGAVFVTGAGSRLHFANGEMSNNSASYGGCLALNGGASALIVDSELEESSADVGGAVHVADGSSLVLVRSMVCTTSSGEEGAISGEKARIHIIDSELIDNEGQHGVALSLYESWALIEGTDLLRNVSTEEGGAVYAEMSQLDFRGCRIDSNESSYVGGGIYIEDHSSIVMTNCSVSGNSVGSQPGEGGGAYIGQYSRATFFKTLMVGNSAVGSGKAVSAYDARVQLTNCTVVDNAGEFAALYVYAESEYFGPLFGNPHYLTITNTILRNAADEISTGGVADSVLVRYSNIQGGRPGEGNIDVDPQFVNMDIGDYHLLPGTPCVDAGDPTSPLDLDQSRADMGAYGSSIPEDALAGVLKTTTLTKAASPHRVWGLVVVPPGNTLTVEPGAEVLFDVYAGIRVEGSLMANGVPGDTIRFVPGLSATWSGIEIVGSDSSSLDHVYLRGSESSGLALSGCEARVGILNSTFTRNIGRTGGAVAVREGSAYLENCRMTMNFSYSAGGAIYGDQARVTLWKCILDSNFSMMGGAIFMSPLGDEMFNPYADKLASGTKPAGTTAGKMAFDEIIVPPPGDGGETMPFAMPVLTMKQCELKNNFAYMGGGAFLAFTMAEIHHNLFENNYADQAGAGLYVGMSAANVSHNVFVNNMAMIGGAIYAGLGEGQPMKLARTAVFEGDLVLNVSNCTFVGNSSEAGSVMFQSYDQPAWINQSILWESGYQPVYSTYGYVKVVASLYDEYGGMDKLAKAGYEELEFGNFYAPPMFKDPENGDYSLLPGSPCIDGGNPLGWKDPDGTRADVGAFVTKQDRPNKIVLKPTKASPGGKTRLMVYGTIVSADSLLVNIALPSYIIDSFTVITSVVDTMTNPVVMKSLDEGDMRVVLKSDGKIAITDQPILELELTINDYFGDWTQTMYIDPRYTRVDTNKAAMYDAKIIIGPIYGDASLNAEVTALDAAWVLQQRVGKRDDVDPRNADVTGNEGLSALDASLIMRKVLDPKFEFPIQNMTVIYRKPAVGARVLSIQKDAISDGWLLGIDDATGVLSGEVVLDIPGTDAVTISGEGMTASSRTGTTVRVAFARLEPGTPVLFTIGTGEDVTPRIISAQLNEGAISVSMRPLSLALKQNVPNPFNPITSITFSLPEHGPASLVVYNQLGQVVRVLADGTLTAGFHHIVWNGRDRTGRNVGSGVYIYRLKTARSALVKRMTLVR